MSHKELTRQEWEHRVTPSRAQWAILVRLAIIVASYLFFAVVLLVDIYVVHWTIPIAILYVIPVIVAARYLSASEVVILVAGGVGTWVLDYWIGRIAVETVVLTTLSFVTIGLLAILWARSERRLASLAEQNAELYQNQRSRAEELEESHRRLQEFFGMVAHDLKSPLTAIMGYAQVLDRSERVDEDASRKMMQAITREAKRIKRLADDLADAAQVGTGHLSIARGSCDLVSLAEHVVAQQQYTTGIHKLTLRTPSGSVHGHWDGDRLAQVLTNLVSNAIKYAPGGGEVWVTIERRDGEVLVSVTDQGVGIPPEDVPALFLPYSRVYRKGGIRGTGLGLYIAKGIVEAHGGRILVESRVGEGSTFRIALPLC